MTSTESPLPPSTASSGPTTQNVRPTQPPLPKRIRRPPPVVSAEMRRSNMRTLIPVAAVVALGFLWPFWYVSRHNDDPTSAGHFAAQKPMTREGNIRGAFLNSGSRDVGPDEGFNKKQRQIEAQIKAAKQQQ